MRQHVNPLSRFFQKPLNLPEVNQLFEDGQLPIHLDIGCARGQFLLELASSDPAWNYLGVEIRMPLVVSAKKEKERLEIRNLNYLYCNANVSLENWLSKLSNGQLRRVTIQFPDPWFKRRHQKRRVLQPSLLISLANALKQDSQLFIQSDIFEVINQMVNLIEASKCFVRDKKKSNDFLELNPFSFPTEREIYVLKNNMPVYRVLYFRNSEEILDINKLENDYNNLIKSL